LSVINSAALIGAGCIGAVLCKTLTDNGFAGLSIVANGQRAHRLSNDGITINGERYFFPVATPDTAKPVDLAIFAVKQTALENAISLMRGFISDNTIILSLLNGVKSEETISAALGTGKMLYSYAVGTDSTRTENGIVCNNVFKVPFGDKINDAGNLSEEVVAVRDFFDKYGVKYEIPRDMRRSMWWKYMMNMGVNQTCAVVRRPYECLHKDGPARDLCRALMREAALVAKYEGVNLDEADIDLVFETCAKISADGKPSTMQDVEAGRETEVEMFSGDLIRMAEKHGLSVPVNETVYKIIKSFYINK